MYIYRSEKHMTKFNAKEKLLFYEMLNIMRPLDLEIIFLLLDSRDSLISNSSVRSTYSQFRTLRTQRSINQYEIGTYIYSLTSYNKNLL